MDDRLTRQEASRMTVLSFDEFRQVLAESLQVDAARVCRDTSFINDLAVDSIRMVEMLLRMEDLGVTVSPDAAWDIRTVGDAYRFYRQAVAADA